MSQPLKHVLLVASALFVLRAPSANLLVNGSFEDPSIASSLSFTGAFSFSGWSGFSSVTVDNPGDVAIVHAGPPLGIMPADLKQVFLFNGGNTTPGGASYVEQTVSNLSTVGLYNLSFDIGRDNSSSTQALALYVDMYFDNGFHTRLGEFDVPTNGGWMVESLNFNPATANTRIRFTEDSALNGTEDLLLDNVSVTPFAAPEPAALIPCAGAVAVWCARRRRRFSTLN
jgi:hypothetical protein